MSVNETGRIIRFPHRRQAMPEQERRRRVLDVLMANRQAMAGLQGLCNRLLADLTVHHGVRGDEPRRLAAAAENGEDRRHAPKG